MSREDGREFAGGAYRGLGEPHRCLGESGEEGEKVEGWRDGVAGLILVGGGGGVGEVGGEEVEMEGEEVEGGEEEGEDGDGADVEY